jgi:predicted TIM-barrel fold metal-dependent hydrolase
VIVDFHTHIFPPHVREHRDDYIARDHTFAEMYADPKAKIATAEDLLASMDDAGVDVSVALGFAWQDHDDIIRHNDYLLKTAARSNGLIVAFTTVNMANEGAPKEIERCAAGGARGLGELRPDNQGWSASGPGGDALGRLARELNLIPLFHVTEPGDRIYPGRHGCSADDFLTFAAAHPEVTVVGGHLGGDCFRTHDVPPNVFVDTAAQPFLYRDADANSALVAPLNDQLLLGSDYPLITQRRQVEEVRKHLPADRLEAALSSNAARVLGLNDA